MTASRLSRRRLLAALARVPVLLSAAYLGVFSRTTRAAAVTGKLEPHHLAALQRLIYLLFPLPELGPGAYQRVAAGIAEAARADPEQLVLIRNGIDQLDAAAGGDFLDLQEPAQLELLRGIEQQPFFQQLLPIARTRLFDDRDVWALIGYEGSSLEKGGYLNRGLADIDWL